MKYNVWQEIVKFIKERRLKRRWRRVLSCLAAVVVFCTVYALILPAITLSPICDIDEHTHTDDCYEIHTVVLRELNCGFKAHVHTEECKDEYGNTVCGQADFFSHTHSEDTCYKDGELVCELPEVKVHAHNESCYDESGVLTCEEPVVLHTHNDTCYDETGTLACGMTEIVEHIHDDSCITVVDEKTEKVLICEVTEHTHTEDCYLTSASGVVDNISWKLELIDDSLELDDYMQGYILTLSGTGTVPEGFFSSVLEQNSGLDSRNQRYINRLVIEEGITKIESNAFNRRQGSGIEEIYISSTVEEIGEMAFGSVRTLRKVVFADGNKMTTLPPNTFGYTGSGIYLDEFTIPEEITTIKTDTFLAYSCETLILKARNLTTVEDNIMYGRYFDIRNFVVSKTVETIPQALIDQINIFKISFEGPNELVIPDLSEESELPAVMQNLGGCYCYIDEQGIVYTLDKEDKAATVAYVSAGLTGEVNIPEKIATENGEEYTVTRIASAAFSEAPDVTQITIESPENISRLADYAFAYITKLESINGTTNAADAKALFENASIGMNIFKETPFDTGENEVAGGDQSEDKATTVDSGIEVGVEAQKGLYLEKEGSTFRYYTGEAANLTVSLSQTEGTSAKGKIVRLYMMFDADGGSLGGYGFGEQIFISSADKSYTAQLYRASIPNTYYWEFPALDDGDAISVNFSASYANYTAGGKFKLWSAVLDEGTEVGSLAPVGDYLLLEWITEPNEYSVNKSYVEGSGKLVGDENVLYVDNLEFDITVSSKTTRPTGVGYDFLRKAVIVDKLELPENIRWRQDVVEAIKAGDRVTRVSENSLHHLYVTLDNGEQVFLCKSSYILTPTVDENNNVIFTINGSTSAKTYTITLGNKVLEVTNIDDLEVNDVISIKNTVALNQTFDYSESKTSFGECTAELICLDAELDLKKEMSANDGTSWAVTPNKESFGKYHYDDNDYSEWYKWHKYGKNQWYRITASNIGMLPFKGLNEIEDTLITDLYIAGEDLQTMFNTDDEKRLNIMITDATLCALPAEKKVITSSGQEVYVTVSNVGSNTDYSGRETTDDSIITDSAVLTLGWNADDVLTLTVSGTGVENKILTIGDNADYPDIQSAMDAVGYVITMNAQYTVKLTYEDGYRLYPGQEIPLLILSSSKDTFMRLTKDYEYYYNYNVHSDSDAYRYYHPRNTVYATDKTGTQIDSALSELSSDLSLSNGNQHDITLNTYLSLDGKSLTAGSPVEIGDILDCNINISKYNTRNYEALPLVAKLIGGQVLMVPVEENSTASWVDKAELFEESVYYLLKEPGVYENVYIGGMWADRVVITATSQGLDTQIYWYLSLPDTPDKSYNYSFKVLADPERAGVVASETGIDYTIGGEVWLNDHETHRLWDGLVHVEGILVEQDKKIVTSLGSTPDEDKLEESSIIYDGDTVTYRLSLKTHKDTCTLYGARMYDVLPLALNNYWEKDVNVSIRYVSTGSSSVTNGDDWYLTNINPATNKTDSTKTQQYLCWGSSTTFALTTDPVYIYITLKFPSGDSWSNYLKTYSASKITNTLYVAKLSSSVSHYPYAESKALLQIGVESTGVYSYASSSSYGTYAEVKTEDGRLYYTNETANPAGVEYYITLKNTGQSRLYLDTIQVILPRGFTCVKPNGVAKDYSTEMVGGREKVNIEVNQNYVNPDKSITILLKCQTHEYMDTDDVATCSVIMPYTSYNNSVLQLDTETKISGSSSETIAPNDGTAYLFDTEQVSELGFKTEGYTTDTQWFASDVTINRAKTIEPNLQKKVKSVEQDDGSVVNNPAGAKTADVIVWNVVAENNGNSILYDYTITDVMPKPYKFIYMRYIIIDPSLYKGSSNYTGTTTIINTSLENRRTTETGDEEVKIYVSTSSGSESIWYRIGDAPVEIKDGAFFSLTLDANGNEVLTLRFTGSYNALPAHGGYGTLEVDTKNNTNIHKNTLYYNAAYFTPDTQSFDRESVTKGTVTTFNEQLSVRASRPITVSYGAFTSSEKSVYSVLDTANVASSMSDDNSIVVQENSEFIYDLSVTNSTSKAMSKLILIDNLPEPGDHSTFTTDEPRHSEFKISLANNPVFTVKVKNKAGTETILDPSTYTLEYSTATEFTDDDWDGKTTWSTDPTGARSIRLIILDNTGTLIPAEAVITLSFNAKIDEGQIITPGAKAWNSFGYHCRLFGDTVNLESVPLNVGISVYNVPSIVKELESSIGKPFLAKKDEIFRFVIYTGAALTTLTENFTDSQLAAALNSGGREFTYAEIIVPEGEAVSPSLLLNNYYKYSYDSATEEWNKTDSEWIWENTHEYTIVELPYEGNDFEFKSLNNSTTMSSYTFLYNNAVGQKLTCTNRHKDWSLLIRKTSESDAALPGAVFGLYATDAAQIISDNEYEKLSNSSIGIEPEKTVTIAGTEYYLQKVGVSEEAGELQFDELPIEITEYVVIELKAPAGYIMKDEPQKVQQNTAISSLVTITVTNEAGFQLPETGGEGRTPYIIVGMLTTGIAGYCIYKQAKRRRKEGMAS